MTTPTPIEVNLPQVAATLLTLAAVSLGGAAPSRAYRSAGTPAYDFVGPGCDSQLTVNIVTGGTGAAGAATTGRAEGPNGLRQYTFAVELVRKSAVPGSQGQAPTQAVLDGIGATHIGDYALLSDFVRSLGNSARAVPQALKDVGVTQVAAGQMSTVGPGGGVVGLRALVTLVVV